MKMSIQDIVKHFEVACPSAVMQRKVRDVIKMGTYLSLDKDLPELVSRIVNYDHYYAYADRTPHYKEWVKDGEEISRQIKETTSVNLREAYEGMWKNPDHAYLYYPMAYYREPKAALEKAYMETELRASQMHPKFKMNLALAARFISLACQVMDYRLENKQSQNYGRQHEPYLCWTPAAQLMEVRELENKIMLSDTNHKKVQDMYQIISENKGDSIFMELIGDENLQWPVSKALGLKRPIITVEDNTVTVNHWGNFAEGTFFKFFF